MATLKVAIDASAAKQGAEEFARAAEILKRQAFDSASRVDALRKSVGLLGDEAGSLRTYKEEILGLVKSTDSQAAALEKLKRAFEGPGVERYTNLLQYLDLTAVKLTASLETLASGGVSMLERGVSKIPGVLGTVSEAAQKTAESLLSLKRVDLREFTRGLDIRAIGLDLAKTFLDAGKDIDKLAEPITAIINRLTTLRNAAQDVHLTQLVGQLDAVLRAYGTVEAAVDRAAFNKLNDQAKDLSFGRFIKETEELGYALSELGRAQVIQEERVRGWARGVNEADQEIREFGTGILTAGEKAKLGYSQFAKTADVLEEVGLKSRTAAISTTAALREIFVANEKLQQGMGASRSTVATYLEGAGEKAHATATALHSIFEANQKIQQGMGSTRSAFVEYLDNVNEKAHATTAALHNIFEANLKLQQSMGTNVRTNPAAPGYTPPRQDLLSLGAAANAARMKELTAAVDDTSRSVENLGSVSARTRTFVTHLFLGFSAAFAVRAAIRETIDSLKDFDTEIGTLRATTRGTDEEIALLAKTARDTGVNFKTSVYGATQAAEGLTHLAKAGLDVREAIAALPGILDFATVAKIDLGTAADTTAKILRQFNIDASRTTEVLDSLTHTALTTTTDVGPLSEALAQVGPVSASLGNDVQSTTAALGALSERVKGGSSAGTALKGVFLSLLNPSDKARAAIGSLSSTIDGSRITLESLNPRAHTLIEILETLKNSNLDAGTSAIIFQRRFSTQALALSQAADRVKELSDQNRNLVGSTHEAAAAINDTLAGSFKQFGSAVEEATLRLGDAGLNKALRSTLNFAREVILSYGATSEQLRQISTSAYVTATALKAVALAGAAVVAVNLISWLNSVKFGITALVSGWETLVILFLDNPFGVVIAAAAALAAGIYVVASAFGEAEDAAKAYQAGTVDLTTQANQAAEALRLIGLGIKSNNAQQQLSGLDQQIGAVTSSLTGIIARKQEFDDLIAKGTPANSSAFDSFRVDGVVLEPTIDFKKIYDQIRNTDIGEKLKKDWGLTDSSVLFPTEAIQVFSDALEQLRKKSADVRKGVADDADKEAAAKSYDEAADALEEYIDDLAFFVKMSGETKETIEVETLLRRLNKKAIGEEKDQIKGLTDQYRPLLEAGVEARKIAEEHAAALTRQKNAVRQSTDAMQELELNLRTAKVGATEGARAQAILTAQLKEQARQSDANSDNIHKYDSTIAHVVGATYDWNQAIKANKKELRENLSEAEKIANRDAAATKSIQEFTERVVAQAEAIKDTAEARKASRLETTFDILAQRGEIKNLYQLKEAFKQAIQVIKEGENTSASHNLEELVAKYELQARAINLTTDELAKENAMREVNNITLDHTVAGYDKYIERLTKALAIVAKGPAKGRDAQAKQILTDLEAQRKALALTGVEQEKAIALKKLDDIATKGLIENYDGLKRAIEAEVEALHKEVVVKQVAHGTAEAFGSAFKDIILGTKGVTEAVDDMYKSIAEQTLQALAIDPIQDFLEQFLQNLIKQIAGIFAGGNGITSGAWDMDHTPAAEAMGNVYDSGQVTRTFSAGAGFDRSQVFNTPTTFQTRTGLGELGEAGPEVIMPVERGTNGKMGVALTRDESEQQPQQVYAPRINNFHQKIYANNPNEFRSTKRQQAETLRRLGN